MDFAAIEQRARRGAAGQNLTTFVRDVVLVLACIMWVRVYWVYIGPNWALAGTIGGLLNAGIDTLLVLAFGMAFALVPPVFISGLVPSTPANMLLSKIQAKYSWPGFLFSVAGGIWLTYESYVVIYNWWLSRPVVVEAGIVRSQALITIFLTIGFTAWAMTRVTPEQWIDLMTQAREVMRLDRELQMEEAALKATHLRAVSLIEMDVTSLTVTQLGTRNRELVTIFAALNRSREQRMASMAKTWKSLHGIDIATKGEPDAVVAARWKQVNLLLGDTARGYRENADYVEEIRNESPAAPSAHDVPVVVSTASGRHPTAAVVARQDAETDGSANADDRARTVRHGPPRTANADADATANADDRAYAAARRELSGAWSRADLEKTLSVQKTKASDLISLWRKQNRLCDVTELAHHYMWRSQ